MRNAAGYLFLTLTTFTLLGSMAVVNQEAVVAQAQPNALDKEAAKVQAQIDALKAKQPKKLADGEPGRGYIPLTPQRRAELQAISRARHGDRIASMAMFQALPAAFDCRDRIPLPIWDQASCGSCYLVSTVRTFTCAGIFNGLGKADNSYMLSAQYGMDRPRNFGGCDGGNGTEVADWIEKNGWIAETYVDLQGVVHNDYPPYEARSGNDRTKAGAKVWAKGWTWGFVNNTGAPTPAEIKAALYNFGRLNIAIDAGGQFGNGTGTITALGSSIDHEINVVAYDDNKDGGSVLLENQWGASWGNGGYRWCTYKAAKNIVDWFWVSAGPLPPPPPPPPSPGGVTVTFPDFMATVGVPVTLAPTASGGTGKFTWGYDYGDSSPVGTFATHTYLAAGTYAVKAQATDSTGTVGSATAKLTVTSTPVPPPPGTQATVQFNGTGSPLDGRTFYLTDKAIGDMRVIDLLSPKSK